ncbi:MAG TPA: cytochrome c [Terriglobales bacterium]|nr:cytochrome c [Terriglobales bacterium]
MAMEDLLSISRGTLARIVLGVAVSAQLLLSGCDVERRKSDAELGLNPQQAEGRKVYDYYCDRCHEPYRKKSKEGPSLQGIFKREYLPDSGLPANNERVGDIIKFGRAKMSGYGHVLSEQQVQDLLAYLHTL